MNDNRSFVARNELRKQARDWVVRFNSDAPPTNEDIDALKSWVAQSPEHERELRSAEKLWMDADVLQRLAVPRNAAVRAPTRWWRAAAVAASIMLAASVGWFNYSPGTDNTDRYTTAIGEQKVIPLPDGSAIELDTDSHVRVAFSDSSRTVYLDQGKAFFEVAKDIERPFDVHTQQGRVRAVGTAFSVSIDAGRVTVTVDEGRVDLARAEPPAEGGSPVDRQMGALDGKGRPQRAAPMDTFASLGAGQQAQIGDGEAVLEDLAPAQLKQKLAWRRGMLIFSGEPLDTVIREIGRYTAVDIEIIDPSLSELPIGGRFRTGELEALLDVLESGFGVEVSYVDRNRIELR